MFRKISWHKAGLAAAAGGVFVLAFIPFHIFPLIFLFPIFFTLLILRCNSFKEGFAYGFLTSFVVNAGGFYWVTYVIHVFGDLSWFVAGLLYLLFCGFGALGFPLFAGIAAWLQRRLPPEKMSPAFLALWFTVALPAWFLLTEYAVPKLFPFYAGHCLYWLPVLTQISELTGSIFLSFAVFSAGGALTLLWLRRFSPLAAVVPVALWAVTIAFGVQRLKAPDPDGRELRVGLIQANIGSLDKVAARRGVRDRVRYTIDRYLALSEEALARTPRPDLLVWPETAMPFHLHESSRSFFAMEIRNRIAKWGIPLITGGYIRDFDTPDRDRDYNGAYLLSPPGGPQDTYRKNILLAFGEYFPGGEQFPWLYKLFPQVSNFARGTEQHPFILADGTRLGITICYEAIVPSFYRRMALHGVQGVVNLTNDSWFGPTSEPIHHGALAVFRTVETRAPLIRVTNTGISFVVDAKGRMSETTGVYAEGILNASVRLPSKPVDTFYLRHGDWFVAFSALLALGFTGFALRRRDVPVPV